MIRVTISTITDAGVFPMFRQPFDHPVEAMRMAQADEYERNWRSLAATAGVMIRVDRETVQ